MTCTATEVIHEACFKYVLTDTHSPSQYSIPFDNYPLSYHCVMNCAKRCQR